MCFCVLARRQLVDFKQLTQANSPEVRDCNMRHMTDLLHAASLMRSLKK
jgi:hypothetical protein